MWNRELKFEPSEILGLLVLVQHGTFWSLLNDQPVAWVTSPYSSIPHEILIYESFRLMHTLVSDTQPGVWHNAVEEALLYGLCKTLLSAGKEGHFSAEIRQTVNAFRRRAGLSSLRNLKDLDEDDWEIDVLDVLLFTDRDWQMADASMILHPELREHIGIAEKYFDVRYRKVTVKDLEKARLIFQEILNRARHGLPSAGLPLIEALHQL